MVDGALPLPWHRMARAPARARPVAHCLAQTRLPREQSFGLSCLHCARQLLLRDLAISSLTIGKWCARPSLSCAPTTSLKEIQCKGGTMLDPHCGRSLAAWWTGYLPMGRRNNGGRLFLFSMCLKCSRFKHVLMRYKSDENYVPPRA